MPVPSTISDLSKVASENSPAGTESVKGTIDDYLRAGFAFLRQLSDLIGGPTVTLASASTVNIGFANSANITITGTTTINAFDNVPEGVLRYVTFSGALTLNNGTLQMPAGANIQTSSGDAAVFKSLGNGNWKCMAYQRISGTGPLAASTSRDGYLSAADWNTFNGKQSALGFAPYPATNPAGYITGTAAAAAFVDAAGDTMSDKLTIDTSSSSGGRGFQINNITNAPEMAWVGAAGSKAMRLNGNTLEVINNAYSAVIMSLSDSGALSAPVVTETSDGRLKKLWRRLAPDLLQNVAALRKVGTFVWRKGGGMGMGGSAQEIEKFLPWAVVTDENGVKSVRYGAAAFVIVVELTRAFLAHVTKTEKRLAKLEAK